MRSIYYIDLFSGAGGTTTGVHLSGSQVIACVNHDRKAIESHKANHPDCIHFIEDIRDFNVVIALKKIVKDLRDKEPDCIIIIWASLECTNYSKAKGGQPRCADSRTLAEHLFMYLEHLIPNYLMIENVREFMSWGPLDENGRPISKQKGRDYLKWVNNIKNFGFDYDWRLLNAANYGSYQSRERFFGQFARKGMPISWPEATHSKSPDKQKTLFNSPLKKWNPVREILDLEDEGKSIFHRSKPLVEATLKRIYAGLIKFVAGGENEFIQKNFSGHPMSKVQSLTKPSGTVTTIDHHSLVFATSYYGNGNAHDINKPCPTLTCKDRFNLIKPQFVDNQYGNGTVTSIDKPNGTITANPKQALVTCKHQYLMNPQFNDKGRAIDKPCFTLIAKMDKRPPYLISSVPGEQRITTDDTDTPMMAKIKEFMILYEIVDIKMRMLKIPELLQIQGFPKNYILKGTQADQKKFIGNAVDTHMSKALAVANRKAILEHIEVAA